MARKTKPVGSSLEDAEDRWIDFVRFTGKVGDAFPYFRGHQECRHTDRMLPQIGRSSRIGRPYSSKLEAQLFDRFCRRGIRFEPGLNLSDWDWLAIAQHNGLPTRLLDWTGNPYIAAYFAVSPTARELAEGHKASPREAEVVAVQFEPEREIPTKGIENWGWQDAHRLPHWFHPSVRAARILTQRGIFSWHSQPDKAFTLSDPIFSQHTREMDAGGELRFRISSAHFPLFRKRLRLMGIDDEHVHNDLQSVARSVLISTAADEAR